MGKDPPCAVFAVARGFPRRTRLSKIRCTAECGETGFLFWGGLSQQPHEHLRYGVGLREHGNGALGQNLLAYEARHFRRHIGIRNAGFGILQVFGLNGDIRYGVFQSVLVSLRTTAASMREMAF